KRVRELLQVVGGELGSLEAVFAEADKLVRATVEADNQAALDRFAAERGQADRAVEGAAATLAALALGQVGTLLLTGLFLDDERTAWFGPAPTDVAADQGTLADLGVAEPVEGRLVDVAVRAALGTGADVRVLDPGDEAGPAEGVGALLRFAVRS
ncbi:MAG TPA: hypothetical protein VG411_17600, partial [Actinomycetota bacterium]|nr:hypothetical protein [Actinomycetota bacterium]